MRNVTVACVQPRMFIPADSEEFETEARRYLRQAQAKAAGITVFPEYSGLMLAPPLISGPKLGIVKRQDEGKRPGAGFLSRRLGKIAGTTAGALGGGFRGSLERLVQKKSGLLYELYSNTFSSLAQEFATIIVAGSIYAYDYESDSIRHRAYVFDADGEQLGFQDKLNLAPDEAQLAVPGGEVTVFETRFGRFGLLVGRDMLYPELARLLVVQGVDLLIGIGASPGMAQANVVRSAMALRAEENQVFAGLSFLLGPNYMGKENREEFYGQSAVLAPISLTEQGDGILVQAGTNRTESLIAAELDWAAMEELRETSGFRPRQEMQLGGMGSVLAELYQRELSIEEAIAQRIAGPIESRPFTAVPYEEGAYEDVPHEADWTQVGAEVEEEQPEAEEDQPEVEEEKVAPLIEDESLPSSIPEALSLGDVTKPEESE
jgi:predicted amidohydrolase